MTHKESQAFASFFANGLTKRECFAAIAMQGLLPKYEDFINDTADRKEWQEFTDQCVSLADMLIESLNNRP